MKRKLLSLFLTFILAIGTAFSVSLPVGAEEEIPVPNNSGWNQHYVSCESATYFRINVPVSGRFKIHTFFSTNESSHNYYSYTLYDDSYEHIIEDERYRLSNTSPISVTFNCVLSKGIYHLALKPNWSDTSGYMKIKTSYTNSGCNTKDNSTQDNPNELTEGKTATGMYTETNSGTSWFKVDIPEKKTVQFTFYSYIDSLKYTLYNKNLTKQYFCDSGAGLKGKESMPSTDIRKITLNKGTYYLKCVQGKETGKYKVKYAPYVKKVSKPKLSCTKVTIKVKGKKQLKVTGGSGQIKWTTSNKKIAAVNSSGKVTGKKRGSCVITATRNGINLKCTVKVK